MKFKFNWGTGIVIVIIIFFASMALRIFLSYQQDLNLVSEDYYPKGINYQEKIEMERNTAKLTSQVIFIQNKEELNLQFPIDFKGKEITGDIHFFRPSDYQLDKHIEISLNDKLNQKIQTKQFETGKYIVKIHWQSDNISYYQEKELFF